jgi:hypothetical protein
MLSLKILVLPIHLIVTYIAASVISLFMLYTTSSFTFAFLFLLFLLDFFEVHGTKELLSNILCCLVLLLSSH